MITREVLERLAEMHAKASAGEWAYDEEVQEAGDYRYFFQTVKAGAKNIYRISGDERDKWNAELIAAMQSNLPDLLARIAEQDRVIARRGELLRICRHVIRATEDDLAVVDRQNVCEVIAAELAGSGEETPAGAGREGE